MPPPPKYQQHDNESSSSNSDNESDDNRRFPLPSFLEEPLSIEVTYDGHPAVQTPTGDSSDHTEPEPSNSNDLSLSSSRKSRSPLPNVAKTVVRTVVPKMERVPLKTFLILSIFVAIPSAIYILCFTRMGKGMDWFYYLAEIYGEYASLVGTATAVFFLVLYMLDADSCRRHPYVQRICGLILILGICLTLLFMVGDYPYGPICLFAFVTPLWLITLNQFQIMGRIRTRVYVTWLSGPLFFISVLVGITWLIWTFLDEENGFNQTTKAIFAEATGCEANLVDYPNCSAAAAAVSNNTGSGTSQISANGTSTDGSTMATEGSTLTEVLEDDEEEALCFETVESPPSIIYADGCDASCPQDVYSGCLNAFILWGGPLLVSLVLFFLSFFSTFLRSANSEKDIVNFGKLWIFLLFTMWLTASLAGVAAGLTSALLALTLASFVGSIIFVAMTRSRDEGKEQAIAFWARINENYAAHLDVARALFLITCSPFIAIYVVLSFFNQMVRKIGLPCSKKLKTPEAHFDYITKRCRAQMTSIQSWDRTKVLTYAIYWGMAFMILSVIVAEFTVLFLSWLIEKTSSMNIGIVTAILLGVGMIMFMIPPVPGPPIYLTLGIVVVATGRDLFGIVGSIAYATAVSLGLKLLACTIQQKIIGESLSNSIGVRKMVQINSTIIKAMRLILAQPGMRVDKVSILVGGPDWPTSVLCGIMGLDLFQVLLGTLPVIVLIMPTVLTGSFTYMASLKTDDGEPEFPYAAVLATVFTAFTAIVMTGSMILAAYHLEQTTSNRSEEIAAIEVDQEVAELEAGEVEFDKCYSRLTQWEVMPWGARVTLYLSFILMVACCYMVLLFSGQCFTEYQLTYTIEENLNGNWLNLIKPTGWYAILFFFVSAVFLSGFIVWANQKAIDAVDGAVAKPAERECEVAPTEEQAESAKDVAA